MELKFDAKLKRVGNSWGFIVPKAYVDNHMDTDRNYLLVITEGGETDEGSMDRLQNTTQASDD